MDQGRILFEWTSYVKIQRMEQKNYEECIVDKCKDLLELFYRYINNKLGKGVNKQTKIQQ